MNLSLRGGENIDAKDAVRMVKRIAPSLGCDFTEEPDFPDERTDVCAVRHTAENGTTYGFDTIYLVWETNQGLQVKELTNSRATKDYIHIRNVTVDSENVVTVSYGSGGSYSGKPWGSESKARI